jgi:hypothetical protein
MEELARVETPPVQGELMPAPAATDPQPPVEVHVHNPGAPRMRRLLVRDSDGNVIGSEEVPIDTKDSQ